ncbi:MAG: hypothetical protein U1E05_13805 [Patescibacteria group bacterium]|nr:hypothetical protein [Patescibacteria group bacterium]
MSNQPHDSPQPMPLVAFERYMWADDWRPYPADGFLLLNFRGRLKHEAFEAAIVAALARHPLLQAWIEFDRRGRPAWREAGDRRPYVTWDSAVRPPACPLGPSIDLRKEIGARFFMAEDGDRTEMLMQMHHACCDGLALLQFAEDLLIEYHRCLAPNEQLELRAINPNRLLRRGGFGLGWWGRLVRLPIDLLAGLAAFEYFGHRPMPVGSTHLPPQDAAVPDNYPAIARHVLTEEETTQLRLAAKRQGVTVNDLLLRDLFLALHEHVANDSPGSFRDVVRIMAPTNLRVPGDEATPAANLVSMNYLDRRPGRWKDAARLLASIHREMRLLKRVKAGITLIRAIEFVEMLPGGLRRLLPFDRCLATAVLSNMGQVEHTIRFPRTDGIYRVGDVVVEGISAAPPLRPMTRASFVALTYAGRLHITLHFDSHVMRDQEGHNLLADFAGRLRQSGATGPVGV